MDIDGLIERLNEEQICETCQGYGEIFGHADGCDNDYCARACGIDDCDGAVEQCYACDGTGRAGSTLQDAR
jgi:hypothetical protein